ncbi:Rec8 like protein-domain-containing protein [Roridomyces roridus]|uniref:Rec8 like protein-domain-containing protein n=1 Tax=Roridomyces roridus TaxID=1738132 RepID=A0AAD7FWN8_9AGAR|nr:Rec8 like protein-domain-containing protein [Roridomyces roridus]
MFYSETILSRRGPLGKVWLAAHMERKLSKTQTLQTDIEQSVGAIMGQEVEVMALRLSGQLLLGVVRIYSRKAKYLLDDCNEALLKIKMAFRPGVVDMTEDQLAVNKNAITLQANTLDIDLLLPDVNWDVDFEDRPLPQQGHHQAHVDDITLRNAADTFQDFDLNDPFDMGHDGIGSQDFLDIGLDWGDGDKASEKDDNDMMSVDGSVGVGRDLPDLHENLDDQFMPNNDPMDMDLFSNHSKSRAGSEHPFDVDMNIDMPDFALDINFGDLGDREKTPGQASRDSSPLSDVPLTPPPEEPVADKTTKAKRKTKEKKQIIDSVTELEGGPGAKVGKRNGGLGPAVTTDVSGILTDQHFLHRSSLVMRLVEIREDPIAHFLPTKVTPNGTFFSAAPPGLAPELAELFLRPVNTLSKRRGTSPDKGPNKRAKLDGSVVGDDEVEQGRRDASVAPSIGGRSDIAGRGASMGPDATLDFGEPTPVDDFQLDVPEFDVDLRKSVAPSELSRLSTPAPNGTFDEGVESYADAACPIVMFDVKPSQTQGTDETEPVDNEGKGYSKNTVKALGIIRKELRPVDGDEDEEKVLSFRKMADKASRRAAASFFFELLVLGTRDCVQLTQNEPFENIEIRGKDKLWHHQRHASEAPSRAASVARSIGSAMGL